MNGIETRFKEGNQLQLYWTKEKALEELERMYKYACDKENECLSLYDVYLGCGIRASSFYYIFKKFPELEQFKTDIQAIVLSRINRGAIKGDYQQTASIWRQKQLGEKDQQYNVNDNKTVNISVTKEEAREISKMLEDEC